MSKDTLLCLPLNSVLVLMLLTSAKFTKEFQIQVKLAFDPLTLVCETEFSIHAQCAMLYQADGSKKQPVYCSDHCEPSAVLC